MEVMSDNELRIKVTELCGWDKYVIIKRGLYYRVNAGGYTNSLLEAWMLPKEEAMKYEMYAENPDVPGCEKVLIKPAPTPDYPNDLNAMHEAEGKLNAYQAVSFLGHLCELLEVEFCLNFRTVHATARQRAEAFVKTMEAKP